MERNSFKRGLSLHLGEEEINENEEDQATQPDIEEVPAATAAADEVGDQ